MVVRYRAATKLQQIRDTAAEVMHIPNFFEKPSLDWLLGTAWFHQILMMMFG
jgi:hypothetical protein